MDAELETLIREVANEAIEKNKKAAHRMYEALIYIANVGSGEAQQEALRALRFRDAQ